VNVNGKIAMLVVAWDVWEKWNFPPLLAPEDTGKMPWKEDTIGREVTPSAP
jgi:hypothetical protein